MQRKQPMSRPRGKNKSGIGRKLKKASAARNRGKLFREEAEETGGVNHAGPSDHVMEFAFYNTRKGARDKKQIEALCYFLPYGSTLYYCFLGIVALLSSSFSCSPSYTPFCLSPQSLPAPPPSTLFMYLPSECLLFGIQFPNMAFTLQTCNLTRKEGLNGLQPHSDNWQLSDTT